MLQGNLRRTRSSTAQIFLLLVALISTFYLLSYRARIESGDTLRAMDALTSLSRHGDWLMDESAWFKPPLRIRQRLDLPLGVYDVEERLNILLALPLLKLAETLPGLGNIHTVWLFNIIVAALSVGLIYLCLRSLDFDDRVSVIVALGSGVATNLWAYSQTFFREPLTGFFILLAVYIIQVTRRRSKLVQLAGISAGLLSLFLAIATKSSAAVAVPAIVAFALPASGRLNSPRLRKAVGSLLYLQVLIVVLLMFLEPLAGALRSLYPNLDQSNDYFAYALRVYLLSPGGSLWGTSPLLLFAVAGCALWWRQGHRRMVWLVWLLCVGYALGHALPSGAHWFGGLSWPPRFLTPIVPALMLAVAPIVESMAQRRRKWLSLFFAALLVYGVWIQFSGVSLSLSHYGDSLPAESSGLSEWEPGLTQPRYFRWVVLPQRWADLGLDFLWIRAAAPWWAVSFALYGLLLALLLAALLARRRKALQILSPLIALLIVPLTYINLQSVYQRDMVTRSQMPALHDVLKTLSAEARSSDVLLLPNNLYGGFMLNHIDANELRVIVLPAALAEAPSEKQAAELVSSNPNDWFDLSSARALRHLTSKQDRLFMLANTNAFMDWSFRPYERYLALHAYPMRELKLNHADGTVRLLEFSTKHQAPNPLSLYFGETSTDFVFGDAIRLHAYTLPGGLVYRAGESLELSLLWQTDRNLDQDYIVAWFIADANSKQIVVQGQDSAPQAGFAATSTWQPQVPVWDNRALRLPESTPAGSYQIWVLIYRHDAESGISRLRVKGANVIEDDTVAVLPLEINIE